jgi:hypothetical protein
LSKIKWTGFVTDIEADGRAPGLFNMLEFGCVKLDRKLDKTFHRVLKTITPHHDEKVLKDMGWTEDWINNRKDAVYSHQAMLEYGRWISENTEEGTYPMLFSDNNGYDYQFINYYFVYNNFDNPFRHTSRNIADIFRGLKKNCNANFKKLRDTKHTHRPVDDAMGNAEALIKFVDQFQLEGLII